MRILIIAAFFPPDNTIAAQRPFVWAREWGRRGHDVTVLTVDRLNEGAAPGADGVASSASHDLVRDAAVDAAQSSAEALEARRTQFSCSDQPFRRISVKPHRAFFRMQDLYRGKRAAASLGEKQSQHGIERHPRQTRNINPFGLPKRLLAWAWSWLKSRGLLSSVRHPDIFELWVGPALEAVQEQTVHGQTFDIAVSTFGPPAVLRIGHTLKRRGLVRRWVVDYRDLWTGNPSFVGFPILRIVEGWLERKFLRSADLVTTVSEPLANDLRKLHPKVLNFPNGYDHESAVSEGKLWQNRPGHFHIVYTGSLYWPFQNPLPLFKALQRRKQGGISNFTVHFLGPGFGPIEHLPAELGISELVRFHAARPRAEALGIQREADALLFLESTKTPGREGVLTGKIFEYLASRRPILAIGVEPDSVAGQLISEASAGASVGERGDEIEGFLDAVAQNSLPQPKGLPERLSRAKIAAQMIECLENLLSDNDLGREITSRGQ